MRCRRRGALAVRRLGGGAYCDRHIASVDGDVTSPLTERELDELDMLMREEMEQ